MPVRKTKFPDNWDPGVRGPTVGLFHIDMDMFNSSIYEIIKSMMLIIYTIYD